MFPVRFRLMPIDPRNKLKPVFRTSERQVLRFGSAEIGLAIVASDMDFIALPNVTAAAGTVAQQVSGLLRQYPHLFRDVDTFPGSIEFVDFHHIPTEGSIDLIFNDLDGVRTTELTNYLVNLDARVYALVMIIKYWAKIHHLTKVRVLSNYALTLLVIFYLQQKSILPSIALLQNDDTELFYIEGWNTGFDKLKYEPRDDIKLYNLLGGFFEYCNTFNFGKNIISTFAYSEKVV